MNMPVGDNARGLELYVGKREYFHFIIIYVEEDESNRLRSLLELLGDCVFRHGGMVWCMSSPIVFATFGFPFPTEAHGRAMQYAALPELSQLAGPIGRLGYGSSFGAMEAQAYPKLGVAPMLEYFGSNLLSVLTLNPGEIAEFSKATHDYG